MSKKVKILILALVGLVVIAAVSVPLLSWYGKQEYVIVSKAFDVKIGSNAELLYFDDGDDYCHAAYSVDDSDYNSIFVQLQKIGYQATQIDTLEEYEWVPTDKIIAAYAVDGGAKVFITKAVDGYTELYFVK